MKSAASYREDHWSLFCRLRCLLASTASLHPKHTSPLKGQSSSRIDAAAPSDGRSHAKQSASSGPTRRMLHDVIILVPFSNFSQELQQTKIKTISFNICSPGRELWHWRREWGGAFRTPKILQNLKQVLRTKIVHTYGTFFENSQNISSKYLPIYRQIHRIRESHSK